MLDFFTFGQLFNLLGNFFQFWATFFPEKWTHGQTETFWVKTFFSETTGEFFLKAVKTFFVTEKKSLFQKFCEFEALLFLSEHFFVELGFL